MTNDVIVGIGSNINPLRHIKKAVELIEQAFSDVKCSRLLETAPLGFKDQENFLNGALRFKTTLNPEDLKAWLLNLEHRLGRLRTGNKNGPRTIDLDILVWNSKIVDKDVYTRDFLRKSIDELSPGFFTKQGDDGKCFNSRSD